MIIFGVTQFSINDPWSPLSYVGG